MGGLCLWSTGGLPWSRMQNLKRLGQITPRVKLGSHNSIFFILIILRGWGLFMVNGWSDVVEDAKFEMLRSNYP